MCATAGSSASTISIGETLSLLDGQFRSFADAVAHGRYTFWIGSGISRGRVDGLDKLVTRVLSHLQQRIDHNLPGCQFKKALEEAMALADLSPTERALVDL